jgi:hypothetical protein
MSWATMNFERTSALKIVFPLAQSNEGIGGLRLVAARFSIRNPSSKSLTRSGSRFDSEMYLQTMRYVFPGTLQ